MIVFYSENINAGVGELSSEDSKHCYKVLRKKTGEYISVLDGKGGIHLCEIEQIEKNRVSFKILESENQEPNVSLPTIGISLLKNTNRFEWFLEKATELGIAGIQPVKCARTLKEKFRKDRAQSIVISAIKQSMRAFLPVVKDLSTIDEVISSVEMEQKYICHYNEENEHLLDVLIPNSPSYILIGPEGDFSDAELRLAVQKGWKMVNISESRLRTETAGITATNIVSIKNR